MTPDQCQFFPQFFSDFRASAQKREMMTGIIYHNYLRVSVSMSLDRNLRNAFLD